MSLRDKFNRLWARSSDGSPRTSGEDSEDSFQKTTFENKAHLPTESQNHHEPPLTPRKLHKAASMTFQAFSDTLRSRARVFYAPSSEDQTGSPESPEPKTPKKTPRRSVIWSSVRSRGSRSARNEKVMTEPEQEPQPEPESEPETPTKINFKPIGEAPRLNTAIPDASLGGSLGHDDVTTPPMSVDDVPTVPLSRLQPSVSGFRSQQLWPSPHTRLKNLSLPKPSSPPTAISTNATDKTQHSLVQKKGSQESLHPSALTALDEAVSEVIRDEQAVTQDQVARVESPIEDAGYASDTESNTQTSVADVSTVRTSTSKPPSLAKTVNHPSPPLEKAAQTNADFRGTFWPATKVIKSSKHRSVSSTSNDPTLLTRETRHEKLI